jgi:flagellar basal body-associated protein FliL
MTDNITVIIIIAVIFLHFAIGFGWVFWKLSGKSKNSNSKNTKK